MIKQKTDYFNVKTALENMLGKEVDVSVNMGRNKFVGFKGVVSACYPALFTVSPKDRFSGKTSFSYSEVMCGNVKITAKAE
ncbi:MAG: Veg family protein [Clostridia bacterium]|nr:Veg family protein [Clostridia bacterium]